MKNYKKGFVLAYTVIIMGIVFVVMAVLVSVVAMQKKVNISNVLDFEKQMFITQQQYNYDNLPYVDCTNYLNDNATSKQELEDETLYQFNYFAVLLKKDYSQIIVYNVDKTKVLFKKTR